MEQVEDCWTAYYKILHTFHLYIFAAFLILVFNLVLTTTSLAIVHEWVPDRQVYKPLPDIVLDAVPATDWTLYLSEVLIMISTNIMVVVILVHRHRFIIPAPFYPSPGAPLTCLRVHQPCLSLYYQSASTSYNCAAKYPVGLSINGKHTFCGDYIYSGHTTILAMSYLMIYEYSPKRYFLLHWASFVMSVAGVIMVLVAHGHYTVDVLIAYYITTRLFWVYHTLANNMNLKQRTPYNYLANVWWFRIFQYFEGNVGGPLPRQYETPLQIVRKYTYRHENRDS
ncbi:LOW QUALITY PROTEIN: phosphatidylcholine:ceramide cholinephosphotransferase 1-like [Diaphorina citri]|uniref:LOW QUALITY PROTEIN: phosphatidylcholine:ceramide cholinephosphotransferase 1-like n=1 Tax=Diaphorina citri TaxID=121845 RepID=A0A1S4EGE1_DIACI|nr:LOW QUALITY PROTEIN: phosphatidylcholine:ceramide cholinephosphotransferase 1-like [Diaphorina citri]